MKTVPRPVGRPDIDRCRRTTAMAAWLAIIALVSAGAAPAAPPPGLDGLVLVKGGTFQMGDLWGDAQYAMREAPVHEVELGSFLIGKREVTVAEFARFVAATRYQTKAEAAAGTVANRGVMKDGKLCYESWRTNDWCVQGPDHPVLMIAWEDAITYCNWLSRQHELPPAYDEKTGQLFDGAGRPTPNVRETRGFRLPTEAEWEFAARERGRKVRFGNGQDVARSAEMNFDAAGTGLAVPSLRLRPDEHVSYFEKGVNRKRTTPVGSFPPNALGLHDMSGNAWEWCTDTTGPDYTAERQVNPCGQGGKDHIVRGGHHDTDAKACRASARIGWYPGSFCYGTGFRVARTVE